MCQNEKTCGHPFCNLCLNSLAKKLCPLCNSKFTIKATNWFAVGLIQNLKAVSINNELITKIIDEIDDLRLSDKEFEKLVSKLKIEKNLCCQEIKKLIETKFQDTHNKFNTIHDNLLNELLVLETNYNKMDLNR